MSNTLLTNVITSITNSYISSNDYGVSLVNIPDFDYNEYVKGLNNERKISVFFLGFSDEGINNLIECLPPQNDLLSYDFSAEAAEESRNTGDESVFRVLIIKRVESEKISSLRWFPAISLETIYKKSCDMVKKQLADSNSVIEALISALKLKSIREILSFERVLDYFESLLGASADELPSIVKNDFYKLGLCSDSAIATSIQTKDAFVEEIKRNHLVVERISNLEQAERQGITNYYAKNNEDTITPRLILSFYNTKNIELLSKMDLDSVEKCLKTAKGNTKPPKGKKQTISPTNLAAQLVFDGNDSQIKEVIDQVSQALEQRTSNKSERIDVPVNNINMQIKTEPVTEKIAEQIISEDCYGCEIFTDVLSPDEAIRDLDKFEKIDLSKDYLDTIWSDLERISVLIPDGESISSSLKAFLDARKSIASYSVRLQDVPMLQVLAHYKDFDNYLKAYEQLLNAINHDFPRIMAIAASNAKKIANILISLDYVFVIGKNFHAIPTPLNPLYLWKYIELAKEIISSKGLNEDEIGHLSDDDKEFILRKAEDIPDPLSVMLLPSTITGNSGMYLPLAGRIGLIPVYSNIPQVNQSESGMESLKQAIIRYLCLYPHAGMMMKISIIDPPSVESVVAMLKSLNKDREFNINGIEVNIFHTKEVSESWIEINDGSLNDGMLGKYKGKRSLNFRLNISSKKKSYEKIISESSQEQHITVIFDPNEIRVETQQNNKYVHIHPLCVPKIYNYNPIEDNIEIMPTNEGSVFSVYSNILEKLNDHPSTFSHTGTVFNTPLRKETYDSFLRGSDWLIILDQSLKSWDISLRAASEKLFYRESDYRSMGIYSNNCVKFIKGYDSLIKQMGNFIPSSDGVKDVIDAIRSVNDDGLLSIVSHSTNRIFDENHGKGSLGLAISSIRYLKCNPGSILVGLDTQLAREWLSERGEGILPDLIGINIIDGVTASIDIIEVKTYSGQEGAFSINSDGRIEGHAVEQASVLVSLIKEMFGKEEKVTTVSRREILRQQVFESIFNADIDSTKKKEFTEIFNSLFAGEYNFSVKSNIYYVDFNDTRSSVKTYYGTGNHSTDEYCLTIIGSDEIQKIIQHSFDPDSFGETDNSNREPNEYIDIELQSDDNTRESYDNSETESNTSSEYESVSDEQLKRIKEKCSKVNKVLRDYGVSAYPIDEDSVLEAARFTRFPVKLKPGETINSLVKNKKNLEIQLEANGEILIDHIRGTNLVAVDVPFADSGKVLKLLDYLELLNDSKGYLDVIAGQKPDGKFEILDISTTPHMLVAGTTGSGKTVFLHSIIVSLLKQYGPKDLQMLIVDPKQTDFTFFEDIPHLYGNHVIIDSDEALEMLQKINNEDKEERTAKLRACKCVNIESYNEKNPNNKMSRLVVIIDEYSDLIQAAEIQGNRKDFENNLCRLLQRVRNLGIHFIIATQRPAASIVTGALKANMPFRVSFKLPSHTDSQTILDMSGAEDLLGKGDMLMRTESDTIRMQGVYITGDELEEFVAGIS